jgi:large subunit ribosomal protein L13
MKKQTSMVKTADIKRVWHMIDCQGQTLGRLSTKIAGLLTGKGKVDYTPHMDMGDFVVVINAKDIKLTGNKLLAKQYSRHSGHPGGFRQESAGRLMDRDPTQSYRTRSQWYACQEQAPGSTHVTSKSI